MKRSLQVTAPLLTAAALSLLTACHQQPEMQRCVNHQNTLVPIENCLANTAEQTAGYSEYAFYYGGKTEAEIGSTIGDGSFAPLPGHIYSRTLSTRNGFGSSAESFFIPVVVGGVVLLGILTSGG